MSESDQRNASSDLCNEKLRTRGITTCSALWVCLLGLFSTPGYSQLLLRVDPPRYTYGVVAWREGVVILSEAGARYFLPENGRDATGSSAGAAPEEGLRETDKASSANGLVVLTSGEPAVAAYVLQEDKLLLVTNSRGLLFTSPTEDPREVLPASLSGGIEDSVQAEGRVWVATKKGLLCVGGAGEVGLRAEVSKLRAVAEFRGAIYFASRERVYILEPGGRSREIATPPARVADLVATNQYLWILTELEFGRRGPAYAMEEASGGDVGIKKLPGIEEVLGVAQVGGEIWFATLDGVQSLEGGAPRRVDSCPDLGRVNTIAPDPEGGEAVWIGSTERAYRVGSDGCTAIPALATHLNFKGFRRLQSGLWAWSSQGAFRYYPQAYITAKLNGIALFGRYFVPSRVLRLTEPRYERGEEMHYPGPEARFSACRTQVLEQTQRCEAQPVDSSRWELSSSFYSREILQLQDSDGNATTKAYYVVSLAGLWFQVLIVFVGLLAFTPLWRAKVLGFVWRLVRRLPLVSSTRAGRQLLEGTLANFTGYLGLALVVEGALLDLEEDEPYVAPAGASLKLMAQISSLRPSTSIVEEINITEGRMEPRVTFELIVELPGRSSVSEPIEVSARDADASKGIVLERIPEEVGAELALRVKLLQRNRFLLGRRILVRVAPAKESSLREANRSQAEV
ncbi:MAG TPA: hypothetical protein VF017_23705 [Thermoanaerobaculia bacterium]|nr:hypothetical protein [Thermoanaerobaculia bacterium]